MLLFATSIPFSSCEEEMTEKDTGDLTAILYNPTNYTLKAPASYGIPDIPTDNPMTAEGITLGKKLFFDPILSADSTMSCVSCHLQAFSFNDPTKFSTGIRGEQTPRSAMSLINLAFHKRGFFWDGRSPTLEAQALDPVENPQELATTWPDVISKLTKHKEYPSLFRKAFGIKNKNEITKELAAKAIAQYERTLISSNSKLDRILAGADKFTDLELYGYKMYLDEDPDVKDAECGHCHAIPHMTSDQFANNGLDEAPTLNEFKDLGLGKFTGNNIDKGKFKAPTLKNIMLTAPYMHDGRFATIDEVLDHYSSGGKWSPNKDPLIYKLDFTPLERRALKAFLETLTDTSFISDPNLGPQ